jgi:hypothetical protein
MRFDYTDSGVAQGRANQDMAKENPNTFATDSGADRVNQVTSLDKPKQRMAGQMGHRIMEYLQNPEEKERTDSWMAMFELSNEGQQFNQAKMGGAGGEA